MVKRAGFGVWGEAPEAGRASVHVADGPEGGVRRVGGGSGGRECKCVCSRLPLL